MSAQKPKPPKKKPSKAGIERMALIDLWLRQNRYPTTGQLAKKVERNSRTIQRDIEFMRNRMGAPIGFDHSRNGFYYTEPNFNLPLVMITEGELIAMFLAEKVFSQYAGTPYEAQLRSAFSKLCDCLPDPVSVDVRKLDDVYSFKTSAVSTQDLRIFETLSAAVMEQHSIDIVYHTMSRDEDTARRVDPYHLANINGKWYLFAHCHRREDVRIFVPARIKSAARREEHFRRPADFNITDYLKGAFSVMKGDTARGNYQIRLRFLASVARYVKERVWHETQAIEPVDDGAVELSMQLESLKEIRRWVLSWGSKVTVIEPDELRAWLHNEALVMSENSKSS